MSKTTKKPYGRGYERRKTPEDPVIQSLDQRIRVREATITNSRHLVCDSAAVNIQYEMLSRPKLEVETPVKEAYDMFKDKAPDSAILKAYTEGLIEDLDKLTQPTTEVVHEESEQAPVREEIITETAPISDPAPESVSAAEPKKQSEAESRWEQLRTVRGEVDEIYKEQRSNE